MSLINDALKRATQAQAQAAATPAPEPPVPMQPVESRRSQGLPMYFTPVLLFIVCGACWFLTKGWEARRQADLALYSAPVTVHARESASLATPAVPTPATTAPAEISGSISTDGEGPIPANRDFSLGEAPSASASTDNASSQPPGAIAASTAPPTLAASTPEESKPSFKLQGIFYRPANPSAVVNSKTVFVGDYISSGTVKAIDRQSVTIAIGTETRVLTLQ